MTDDATLDRDGQTVTVRVPLKIAAMEAGR